MEERIAVMLTKKEIKFIADLLESYAITNRDVFEDSVVEAIMEQHSFLTDHLNA